MSVQKELLPFQSRFFLSRARYPAFVAAWGSGKTLTALLKIIWLCNVFDNNYAMVIRKKYTDLRDSTQRDFAELTGLKVPKDDKQIILPGTNSIIAFRHGEELTGLQNVNLGCFYMEQAEEFETEEQFDLIRGRMRRKLTINPEFTVDAQSQPELAEYHRWLITQPDGCRQGLIIANTNGHNWIWRRWKKGDIHEKFEKNFDDLEDAA